MRKRSICLLLALVLAFGLLPTMTARAADNPFVDVSTSDAFYGPVMWAYYHRPVQITDGVDPTHFAPNKTVTRGQAVTFLWRAAGKPDPAKTKNSFTDNKSGKYYYTAVLWAYYNDPQITNGTSATTFSPDQTCNRAQILTYLWRSVGQPEPTISNPYSDVKTGKYYTKAAIWAYEKGIEKGSGGKFLPDAGCTRAAIVTYIYRVQYKPLRISQDMWYTSSDKKLHIRIADGGSQFTYNWQEYDVSRRRWANFKITNTMSQSAEAQLTVDGRYRCEVYDETGAKVTSRELNVSEPLEITLQPATVQLGGVSDTATLRVEASGGSGTITYQWQKWDFENSEWVNEDTGKTLNVPGTNAGRFRCVVSDTAGAQVISNMAMVYFPLKYVSANVVDQTGNLWADFYYNFTGGVGEYTLTFTRKLYERPYSSTEWTLVETKTFYPNPDYLWISYESNGTIRVHLLAQDSPGDYDGKVHKYEYRCVVRDYRDAIATSDFIGVN